MASKRRQRRRGCDRKQAYDKDTAFNIALSMRRRYPGQKVDAYPCESCGQWHVGHRPWKVQNKINKRKKTW